MPTELAGFSHCSSCNTAWQDHPGIAGTCWNDIANTERIAILERELSVSRTRCSELEIHLGRMQVWLHAAIETGREIITTARFAIRAPWALSAWSKRLDNIEAAGRGGTTHGRADKQN